MRVHHHKNPSLIIAAIVAVAMLVMAFGIQLIIGTLSYSLGLSSSFFAPNAVSVSCVAIVWATVCVGAFIRWSDVRAGGAVIARSIGAVHASDRTRYPAENTLLQIVAELAIASHCARPEVFVLREERSINSLVVGSLNGDLAIVVTAGALDELSRDELSGIVAHEFAHITNCDLAIHMRLLVVFAGLLYLDRRGRGLLNRSGHMGRPSLLKIGGWLSRILGSMGVLSTVAIRALFLRHTEYDADEKAVDILRCGKPLEAALYRIQVSEACDDALSSLDVMELQHICIHAGNAKSLLSQRVFNHSPLDARIQGLRDVVQPMLISEQPGASSDAYSVTSEHHDLSARGVLVMRDSLTSMAALYALFLPSSTHARDNYLSSVSFAFNPFFAKSVENAANTLPMELAEQRAGVVQYAASYLRDTMDTDAARKVVLNLERLLKAQELYDLMSCAAVQSIRHELNSNFPILINTVGKKPNRADRRLVKKADQLGEEFALLLSLMLESSNVEAHAIEAEYKRLLSYYTDQNFPRRTGRESVDCGDIEAAFQTLLIQPVAIRESFVQHCLEISTLNEGIEGKALAEFHVFAHSLRCDVCGDDWQKPSSTVVSAA